MGTNTVIKKFEELPPKAQKQVSDFVSFLYKRYAKPSPNAIEDKPITESPFVGMWADREDMADSTEWVRKQRKELWAR